MKQACERCGSYAINHHCHGRDGSDQDLCDVCYWRKRAEFKDEEPIALVYRSAVLQGSDGLYIHEITSEERIPVGAELFIHP